MLKKFTQFNEEIKLKTGDRKTTVSRKDVRKSAQKVVNVKEPKEVVLESIQKIKDGDIKDKKGLWESMDDVALDDEKKVKLLNFYLKLEGWDGFNKLFDKKNSTSSPKKVW